MANLDETGLAVLWSLIKEEDTAAIGTRAQIAVGSYTGVGYAGSSFPTSLTFDFEPKFVMVQKRGVGTSGYRAFFFNGVTSSASGSSTSSDLTVEWDGKTVSWYADMSSYTEPQLNVSGTVYDYIAIC